MNKRLMALAVAGALAAPVVAYAQASNVTIYGRANVGLDSYAATRCDGRSGIRLQEPHPRL